MKTGLHGAEPREGVGGHVGGQLALVHGHDGEPEQEQAGREEAERGHQLLCA